MHNEASKLRDGARQQGMTTDMQELGSDEGWMSSTDTNDLL